MAPLFRRLSAIHCFFCQSTVTPSPRDVHNFRCPSCSCWNRYNDKGEIISDEPAMHEEQLNRLNFAKRGMSASRHVIGSPLTLARSIPLERPATESTQIWAILSQLPDKSNAHHEPNVQLPTLARSIPNFLHVDGLTLNTSQSPEYNQRLKQLPVYKESLYSRYPPVCDNCRPAVEEEMQNKEQMARRKALNGWLKGGKERQRQVSGTRANTVKDKIVVKSLHWRIRGALWFASAVVSISSLVLGESASGGRLTRSNVAFRALRLFHLVSPSLVTLPNTSLPRHCIATMDRVGPDIHCCT
jgi:Ima1 N-terminal domain